MDYVIFRSFAASLASKCGARPFIVHHSHSNERFLNSQALCFTAVITHTVFHSTCCTPNRDIHCTT